MPAKSKVKAKATPKGQVGVRNVIYLIPDAV